MNTEKAQDKVIKFSDIKEEITKVLNSRSKKMGIKESVTLFDGFVRQPFNPELSSTYVIGGPTVPMIMLVGNETGQVYFFALKAVLDNITL
ncbi:hypothetical protein K2X40_04090 [Candidatus Babeliales bacterium]|nr:hypothetical protein [Candidatus Babeliales bacterium]